MSKQNEVTYPYCNKNAELVTGKEVYPHLPDLYKNKIWRCLPCKAWVGCHANSDKNIPLGRLANAELRKLKMDAHRVFDPNWKSGQMRRKEAYQLLANKLSIQVRNCHIGMFDEKLCQAVVLICQKGLTANA